MTTSFQARRADLATTRAFTAPPPPLEDGQARLAVDRFALTANNVTYAVFGEAMAYWSAFPVEPGDGGGEWGNPPVWGFAEVTETRCADLAAGDRFYGYLPAATDLVVEPGAVDPGGFDDALAGRQPPSSWYRRYAKTTGDPAYDAAREGQQSLFWPLFTTAYLLDDLLADTAELAAASVVLSGASAKTALATAYFASRRGAEVVGLTSPGHAGFCESLGVYDRVVTYGAIDALETGDAAFVDIAGSAVVRGEVHRRLGERLVYSALVGAADWSHVFADAGELPGPAPAFFFVPNRIDERRGDWGAEAFDARLAGAWRGFVAWSDGWLRLQAVDGPEAVAETFARVREGDVSPEVGYVCTMQP